MHTCTNVTKIVGVTTVFEQQQRAYYCVLYSLERHQTQGMPVLSELKRLPAEQDRAPRPDNERAPRGPTTHWIANTLGPAGRNHSAARSHWNQPQWRSERGGSRHVGEVGFPWRLLQRERERERLCGSGRAFRNASVTVLKSRQEQLPLSSSAKSRSPKQMSYGVQANTVKKFHLE